MAINSTKICNMGLSIIGSLRIKDLDSATENSPQIIQCRLHYEPTRDALLRSHRFRFAAERASLAQDTTDPVFEYDNQFILPTDFMALRSIFGNNFTATGNTRFNFAIEGQRLLTDEGSVDMRYTKRVTDVSKFDSLYVKVLALLLADEFIGPLAGGDPRIQKKIDDRLDKLMPKVRAMDRQETNTIGRLNQRPWAETRVQGGGLWRIDRV